MVEKSYVEGINVVGGSILNGSVSILITRGLNSRMLMSSTVKASLGISRVPFLLGDCGLIFCLNRTDEGSVASHMGCALTLLSSGAIQVSTLEGSSNSFCIRVFLDMVEGLTTVLETGAVAAMEGALGAEGLE